MHRAIPALGILAAALVAAGPTAAMERPHHLDDAIRAQQRLTESRPGNTRALNDLGNLLALAGRTERAEEVYRRALELAPDDPTLHYNLGLLLRQTGRPKAAVRALERVVEINPDDAWAHYQLGTLLEEKRKRSKALQHFSTAFLIEPQLAELEINPQLLDSRLVTHALTIAYVERVARLESAPRQYEQPRRITGLLVPEARRRPAGKRSTDTEAEPGERGRKKRKKKTPPGAS